MIIRTGVFATDAQLQRLQDLAQQAHETPIMTVGGYTKHDEAWKRAKQACHKAALENGLPDIQGQYGLDINGEFVRFS